MISAEFVSAAAFVTGGLLIGAVGGRTARRLLGRSGQRTAVQEIARPTGLFLFWIATAAGIVGAVAATSPETLKPLPTRMLQWLPNALVAGLLIIVGYALAVTLGAAVSRAAARASGSRQSSLERVVRTAILAGAIVLALAQVGVETTILNILVGAVALGAAAALAGIATVGSQPVATNLAAGRVVGEHIELGELIDIPALGVTGLVASIGNTHTVLTKVDGGRVVIPNVVICREPVHVAPGAPSGRDVTGS